MKFKVKIHQCNKVVEVIDSSNKYHWVRVNFNHGTNETDVNVSTHLDPSSYAGELKETIKDISDQMVGIAEAVYTLYSSRFHENPY